MAAKLGDQDGGSDLEESLREPVRPDQSGPVTDGPGVLACADLEAMKLVQRAKGGDPGAVGRIFTRLALHLSGQTSLPREHAAFCSEAFLELAGALEAAEDEFRACVIEAMEELGDDPEAWAAFRRNVLQGRGPRLPEQGRSPDGSWSKKPSRDHLGRAFCKAFHISRRPGAARTPRGWMPYRAFPFGEEKETVRTRDDYLHKMSALLHYGESQTQAIKILRSAVKNPKGATTIRRWMEEVNFHEKIDERERVRKTLNFGFIVLAWVEVGIDLEEACSMLARAVVQRSCGLPDATVFLQSRTVKAAYELALKRSSPKSARNGV